MIKVSSEPFLKLYIFPLLSFSNLVRWIALITIVALPFFLAYSTPNFYLSSKYSVSKNPRITFNHKYHIRIDTDSTTFIYTNLFLNYPSKLITISQKDQNSLFSLNAFWSKSQSLERVVSAEITLYFNYQYNGNTQFGTVSATIRGFNIAECSFVGVLTAERGAGFNSTSQNNFELNSYETDSMQQQMIESKSHLSYEYSVLPINMQSDLLSLRIAVNYGAFSRTNSTALLLGQLIWSWIQYFPLFLWLYYIADKCLCFLLKNNIIKRKISHSKQMFKIISL